MLTASEDKTARIWDARSGELRHELGSGTPVLMAHFSPDGQLAATGTDGGSVLLWSVSSGELLSRQAVQLGRVNWLAFSPNGSRLISAHAGGRAGRRHGARLGHSLGGIGDAALATCCRSLVGALQPQWAIRRHRLERWQRARLGRRDRTAGFAAAVALDHVEWAEFSPDGERVVTASGDNKAHIWDVRTGKTIGAPLRHLRTVNRAGFSPDGRRVLTASLDRTARIWDANTGEPVTEAFQHNDGVTQACFSPDGARVLTGTWNSQARLWDAATGRPLTEWLETGRKQVTSACFDPTGQRIATGTFDQVARVWEVPPIPVPVPAWFIELAEGVAGVRLGAHGSVELIPAENVLEPMQRAKASMAEGFYDQVGRWFVTGLDVRARSVLKQGEAISETPIPNAAERR